MELQEFSIESRKELFRVAKIRTPELMSLAMNVDFDSFNKTTELIEFVLEHIEVKILETWCSLKAKGREIYLPADIEADFKALDELFYWFMINVLKPVFQKSRELK